MGVSKWAESGYNVTCYIEVDTNKTFPLFVQKVKWEKVEMLHSKQQRF